MIYNLKFVGIFSLNNFRCIIDSFIECVIQNIENFLFNNLGTSCFRFIQQAKPQEFGGKWGTSVLTLDFQDPYAYPPMCKIKKKSVTKWVTDKTTGLRKLKFGMKVH